MGWVDFFRGRADIVKPVKMLIASNQALLCGVVISEIVQGIKAVKEQEIVKEAFRGIPYIEMDRTCWGEASNIALKLHKRGKIIPLTDIFMATLVIHYELEIFTFDKHFEFISGVLFFTVNLIKVRERAEELVKLNFGIADAAHVAFAEYANAQFITCDDMLIKKCLSHRIAVWCGNPVSFCEKEDLK